MARELEKDASCTVYVDEVAYVSTSILTPNSPEPAVLPEPTQVAIDLIDEASMESFPCSDPPGYTMTHS